ncbi:hypothetical protein KSX_95200 [Ktedonospora formicarum]|uniref:Uncharacterized protein n=1 Tax=Ktedonospora formicarum TaxID=2778364 RepID=A0A8J3MWE5_9CHLR|nr:hypothetical protein KSX_95200 [Ktedonospora formicarum]
MHITVTDPPLQNFSVQQPQKKGTKSSQPILDGHYQDYQVTLRGQIDVLNRYGDIVKGCTVFAQCMLQLGRVLMATLPIPS